MNKDSAPDASLRETLNGRSCSWNLVAGLPRLETERLVLRRMKMRDARELYEWSRDPEVARYVLWTAHRSIWETREYLRYIRSLYRRGLPSSWGIELKETGELIGTIGVMAWFPDYRSAEVGYSLGRAWWHRGYATEALEGLMDFLFEKAGLNRVEAQCDVRNPNSARVMEKCGMRREGLLRQRVINKGEPVDVLLYARLAEDRKTDGTGKDEAGRKGPSEGG